MDIPQILSNFMDDKFRTLMQQNIFDFLSTAYFEGYEVEEDVFKEKFIDRFPELLKKSIKALQLTNRVSFNLIN